MSFLNHELINPVFLSVQLASLTTILLLLLATPLSWWLTQRSSIKKTVIEAIVSLPLVLPPTVLGFYLLLLLNPHSFFGKLWHSVTEETLVFNFNALLIGSLIYSLPFVVRPLMTAFEALDPELLEAAATLKAKPLDRFISIVLPLSKPGYVSAALLSFSHTLGEFGVVLMLGGNIPGKTRTVSIAIYDSVEQLQYKNAHLLSILLVALSFIILFILFYWQKKIATRKFFPC